MDIINFLSQDPSLFLILVAVTSLLIGSFLNVVIYRLPRIIEHEWSQECREYLGLKEADADKKTISLSLPLSHCTQCKKNLKTLA